jgi:PD-(D/E)XK nuclease superfamily protein
VQVKYARSDGCVIAVQARSHSLTNGKVKTTKYYTAATIDWLAVWEPSLDRCFYVPASELGGGMSTLALRLTPSRNGQVRGIRPAERYTSI